MASKELQIEDIWNEVKRKSLSEFIVSQSQQQTKERRLKNELLSIKYQIEDYFYSFFSGNYPFFIDKTTNSGLTEKYLSM